MFAHSLNSRLPTFCAGLFGIFLFFGISARCEETYDIYDQESMGTRKRSLLKDLDLVRRRGNDSEMVLIESNLLDSAGVSTTESAVELVLPMKNHEDEQTTLTSGLGLGDFVVHTFFNSKNYYNDNIFRTPNNEVSDFMWNLTPGVMVSNFDLERKPINQFTLRYAPTMVVFVDGEAADSVEQDAFFKYQHDFSQTQLKLEQRFQHLTGNNEEVGTRIRRNIYRTVATLDHSIDDKTMLESSLSQQIENYPTAINATEWSGKTFVLYEVTPKLNIGPGIALGHINVQGAPNHYFQQVLARGIYQISERIDLSLDGGMDIREYSFEVHGARFSGIFHGNVEYRPFDFTTLIWNASRGIQNSSIIRNQNYTRTIVSFDVKQRLIQKLMLGALFGYEQDTYDSLPDQNQIVREDDYEFVRGSLGFSITDWCEIDLYTFYRSRSSSLDPFSYDNREVGFELRMEF